MNEWKWIAITAFVSGAAGWLFYLAGIFLPWLLGPLFIMMVLKNTTALPFYWPSWLRNIGLLVIGIQMGTSFTSEAIGLMVLNLPLMLVITLAVVGFTCFSALALSKLTDYHYETALLGCFPGGLSQMVLLSEEVKGAEPSAVALMQTIRILLVITVVPFLVTHFIPSAGTGEGIGQRSAGLMHDPVSYLLLAFAILFILLIMRQFKFPIPFMLSPLLCVAGFNVITAEPFLLPDIPVAAAQVMLGAHLGLQMKGLKTLLAAKPLLIVIGINLALIAFCIGISFGLNALFSFPLLDMFLSAAPGGVAEMAITAYTVGADVSTVTSFHLFRIFFILFAAAPLTVYLLKKKLAPSS
ncbi:AbrB family transcriptional regulator [Jeotgalibacillus proteolyticus]|uniref:AbrB family transcriptional regulator n=1 Tax=Jeotgalibacillus proteolyticus TaxID=2082395 RepID=A0A2S5GF64_9BACL|nr:AbrB family transcriptional regulator [Jeotgalibacillus proteolyticus]PPA71555.1 AbrB family transcriptional regulator [Jeotgalibacillus proteolyticus]